VKKTDRINKMFSKETNNLHIRETLGEELNWICLYSMYVNYSEDLYDRLKIYLNSNPQYNTFLVSNNSMKGKIEYCSHYVIHINKFTDVCHNIPQTSHNYKR
jgi:hypothetical protein